MNNSYNKNIIWLILLCLFDSSLLSQEDSNLALDFLGDSHYSLYNFTDAVIPYYAQDSWIEAKATLWIDEDKRLAPYLSFITSHMGYIPGPEKSEYIMPFFWQKYIQGFAGIQFYPFYGENYNPSFGFRLFAFGAYRHYYDKILTTVPYSDLVGYDIQIGGDYYYDNIFCGSNNGFLCRNKIILSVWSNATLRHTNFNRENFNNLLLTGNVKIGRKLSLYKRSMFFPYVLVDGIWIPFCSKDCNWYENYVHFGLGIRLYPRILNKSDKPACGFLRRFHIYIEGLDDGFWLKGQPPERTQKWDLRYGVGFSTPGIFRSEKNEKNYTPLF